MEMITDAELLRRIDAFVADNAKHGMTQTRFGREAMADGALIPLMREGRSLSLKNAEKVLRYMADYTPPIAKAADEPNAAAA